MQSVADSIRCLAEKQQRYMSVEVGWQRFLHYLEARNGADLQEPHRGEIAAILEYIDDVIEDGEGGGPASDAPDLEAFGRYDDVIAAFEKFRVHEQLPPCP